MVEVKFCGIIHPRDAVTAVELGARYVGMIFASSPRQVTPEQGRDIVAALRAADVATVGVFDDIGQDEILAIAEGVGLDCVQLHAWSDPEMIGVLRSRFDGDVWAVSRVGPGGLDSRAGQLFGVADGVLLDTQSAKGLGGSGTIFDWPAVAGAVATVRGQARLIVAGGLRAENVCRAVEALDPDVVDVSSGVEHSPGIKDPQRMRAFVAAVRACVPR